MKLGEKIKKLRNDAGLTQPELAQNAGIEQSYLSKLENDKGSPSFEVISKIASAFNIEAMTLIDSLDTLYIQESLVHLPEIAVKLEERRNKQQAKFKLQYAISAILIVLGLASVLLGNSTGIFADTMYEYKSMGLIEPGELNNHFTHGSLHEVQETRDERTKRIKLNAQRIDEMTINMYSYIGEGFVNNYGEQRRYFRLENERPFESPWHDIFVILGFVLLTSGGFGLGYVFKFSR